MLPNSYRVWVDYKLSATLNQEKKRDVKKGKIDRMTKPGGNKGKQPT